MSSNNAASQGDGGASESDGTALTHPQGICIAAATVTAAASTSMSSTTLPSHPASAVLPSRPLPTTNPIPTTATATNDVAPSVDNNSGELSTITQAAGTTMSSSRVQFATSTAASTCAGETLYSSATTATITETAATADPTTTSFASVTAALNSGSSSSTNPPPSVSSPATTTTTTAAAAAAAGGGKTSLPSPPPTTTATATTSTPAPPTPPFLDPNITPAVHSIIHLLQLYGPLSYEQLKYNMVPQLVDPITTTASTTSTPAAATTNYASTSAAAEGKSDGLGKEGKEQPPRRKRDKLQKVLDILYELGIIHLVDKRKLKGEDEVVPVGAAAAAPLLAPAAPAAVAQENALKESTAASLEEAKEPNEVRKVSSADGTTDVDMEAPATGVEEEASKPAAKAQSTTTATKEMSLSDTTTNKSTTFDDEVLNDPNPIYCFGNGIPRMDVIQPMDVLNEIRAAGQEIMRTNQRIEILRKALMVSDEEELQQATPKDDSATGKLTSASGMSSTTLDGKPAASTATAKRNKPSPHQHASQVLKQLYQLHPEIVNDPVYAAALRMFRVNVGTTIDHHKMFIENDPEIEMIRQTILHDGNNSSRNSRMLNKSSSRKRSASTSEKALRRSSSGDSGKKKRKKGRPAKSNSSDKLSKKADGGGGGSGGDAPMVRANASWA